MPCYDSRNTYENGLGEGRGEGIAEREALQNQVDKMARWLCSILGMLEASGIEIEFQDKELKVWWDDHKAFDEARKK
jgi:hypothetical protein